MHRGRIAQSTKALSKSEGGEDAPHTLWADAGKENHSRNRPLGLHSLVAGHSGPGSKNGKGQGGMRRSIRRWRGALTLLGACFLGMCLAAPAGQEAASRRAGACETIALPGGAAMDLVWIPAGTFLMGQKPEEQDAYPNKETPQHPVTLSHGFWMGKYEVTKAQWQAIIGTAPWTGRMYVSRDLQTPAVYIGWHGAQAFCEKLSRDTGRPFRLPTEAEWEYACRAGTTTRFYWGDDPPYEDIDEYAWWRGNALVTEAKCARPVGLKSPNLWGLHDMSGNVSEWCQDWHWFYFDGPVTNPVGPLSADHRVLRGGSWLTTGGRCRSSRRNHDVPSTAHSHIGFRVVCGPTPEKLAGEPVFTDVFVAGAQGVSTYRIPAMLVAPDGALLAFCEARKESQADASPTDLVLRRSCDEGRTWLPTQVLVPGDPGEALMNPSAVVDRSNSTIILACMNANKLGLGHNQQLMLTSRDNGATWSDPLDMGERTANHDDRFVPGPGVGLQMQSGRLVIPGYVGEVSDEIDEGFYSCVLYSDDHGQQWTLGGRVRDLSDESQAVELTDGTLMLNMRGNMGKRCRGIAVSKNGGETWSEVRWDQALNECPCQASTIRYSKAENAQKDRLLFANPDNTGEYFGAVERTKMTLRLSYDEGNTWPVKRLIHAGPSSYSSIVRLANGDIGLLFEGGEKHRREWIRFARFSLEWLTAGTDSQRAFAIMPNPAWGEFCPNYSIPDSGQFRNCQAHNQAMWTNIGPM